MVQVYSRALYDRYHASSSVSLAGLFNLLCWACFILAPIFIACASDGVWIRLRAYHDQPRLTFTRELIVEANGVVMTIINQSTNQYDVIYQTKRALAWSTNDPSTVIGSHYPIWKHSEIDENADGIIDRITGSIIFTIDSSQSIDQSINQSPIPINQLSVAFGVRCEIASRVRVSMISPIIIDMSSSLPGRGAIIQGNLAFQSVNPINRIGHRAPYNQSLFVDGSDIQSVKQQLANRNDSIIVNQPLLTWQPLAVLSTADQSTNQPISQFTISYDLRSSSSLIWYVPDWSEELKQAWIQWVAFAVLIGVALMILRTIVYERRWIITSIVRDTLSLRKKVN